ncbi:ChbG/HpnK family deacetylase [Acidovorax sp. NCPPB 2350]|nr:ChbG/HpnK family deacetylase [Acidovorax sp. NCPPB 2350]
MTDDFGQHAGINEAALRLASAGRIGGMGCLVGGPAWRRGAQALRGLPQGAVDVGLHLDFTEFPLVSGFRGRWSALVLACLARRADAAAIRREIRAQLSAFEHEMGRAPAFVDGHRHVHQLPVIRDELMRELAPRYGGTALWVRSTRRPPAAAGGVGMKAMCIEWLGNRGMESLARRNGFRQNRHLLGIYGFSGGAEGYGALLRGWLRIAQDGDLLMSHPSAGAGSDSIHAARMAEYSVLSRPDFGAWMDEQRLEPMPLSRILEAPG